VASGAVGRADVAGWSPADIAQLMWGLGALEVAPPPAAWLQDMAEVSRALMSR
jgi:hypothetical protein